jgi:hypothetical protein
MQQFYNMLAYLYPWSLNSIESPFRELTDIQVDNIMEFVLRSVLGSPSWLDTTIDVDGAGGQQSLRNVLNKIICLAILRSRGTPDQRMYAKEMLRQTSNAFRELYLTALKEEMPESDRAINTAHW